jgi:hypothetical protein
MIKKKYLKEYYIIGDDYEELLMKKLKQLKILFEKNIRKIKNKVK